MTTNPLVIQDGLYPASLDGINLAGNLIVEIKCPFQGRQSKLWQEAATAAFRPITPPKCSTS